ncbi:hypothetical protein [Methylosarcina fibrata]|uniref:hypothetical protein n=1 Tax=Methylosarcina fibrata TaxID=105972 RepID=UPI00035DE5D2|nr:hypothetical protein [Methylosarcina fibrata]
MATVKEEAVNQPDIPIIANMYERWTLDYIIELVQLIAMDFVCRPRQYREVPANISKILQNFRFLSGTDPEFPSRMQRVMTFEALLGSSDGAGMTMGPDLKTGTLPAGASGTGAGASSGAAAGSGMNVPAEGAQFKMEAARLRETARAYTERQVTQGEGQLLQAFLDEGITLQSYLRPIDDQNNVVIIGDAQTKAIFDFAVQVLRDKTVAGRFGRPPAFQRTWPLGGALDENGSLLIQEIGRVLVHGVMPSPPVMPVSQNKFNVMQRIAHYGALTITGVIEAKFPADPSEPLPSRQERFEPLIGAAYSWKTALDNLASVM